MDKSKWEIFFHNLLGINWHMQTGGNAVRSGQQINKIVEVTLRTFARGNIDLLREILPEYTRGKFISGFIFPR